MRYAAVVLYFRLGDRIYDTLDALNSQSSPPERIVLVDNASGDGVLDGAAGRYKNCSVLRLPANVGYAAGMNAGAALARTDVDAVLFMTHELLLTPRCVSQLLSALQSDPAVALVGPALRLLDDSSIWSLGGVITRMGDVRHNTSESRLDTIDWLDGACLLIREQSLEYCGGFDPDYFLYWEDVDLSIRVSRFAKIRCVADATAYQSTATAPIYFRLRNQIMCWRKNASPYKVAATIVAAIARIVVKDIRFGSIVHMRTRCLAIAHGFSGRLAPEPIRSLRV